ncbi:uncharacterized protein TNCV_5075341 [Trichonephila clavipes]|uniref:Secreted protein n=1 Tax=Trichonephila clavipes TaxID=2585209 RepID=A0A8X6RSQ1_TRICX|nr:uncharacterized protein TNCV_5075341 [Trichonephila clavipes]
MLFLVRFVLAGDIYMVMCRGEAPPDGTFPCFDMLGSWIYKVVSLPVRVHLPDTIGNETHQTSQCASRHQQSSGNAGRPRRGLRLCAEQLTTVHD